MNPATAHGDSAQTVLTGVGWYGTRSKDDEVATCNQN